MKQFLLTTIMCLSIAISGFAQSGTTGDLTWEVSNGTLTISGTGAMPDYYNDDAPWYPYRFSIQSVVISDGVASIGNYTFSDCSSLTSITIPNSVTSIGDYAFYYCRSLTSIDIPNSVTSIGDGAFYVCNDLTSIVIPNSVTSIGDHAFAYCISLTSIEVNTGNNNYKSENGVLFNKAMTTLIAHPAGRRGGYAIPNSVTSIGNYAFYHCSSLTSIDIPNSVTSIGNHAFYGCRGLTSIEIPNSVTSIGDGAFGNCISLTSIEVNTGNNNYKSENGVLFNKAMTTIVIYPAGKQGGYAIPNSVTSIGNYAFFYCSSLTSIDIPNSVTSIGDYVFFDCNALTSITIPNSVTSIGNYAFSYCSSLASITIPNSVTSVGDSAFENTAWYNNQPDGIIYIGNALYKYKGAMPNNTTLNIRDGIVSVSPRAFYNYGTLAAITIPNSVTSIGDGAFWSCSSLTSVTIPNSVTSIGDYAFYNCRGLTSVTIPNSVTSIGSSAFGWCYSLTSLTIPNSVTSIGEEAFYNCYSLKHLYVNWELPITVPANIFDFVPVSSCVLYVPYGSKERYEQAAVWQDFMIQEEESASSINTPSVASQASNVRVYHDGTSIVVAGATVGETIHIYNVSGVLIETQNIASLQTTITVPQGVYVVKVGAANFKVISNEF